MSDVDYTNSGGGLLAKLLQAHGVEYVLGMPGETAAFVQPLHSVPASSPRYVLLRDERNAPYAAIGYARVSGKIMAVDAGGPGVSTVMMTAGLAEAANMSLPVLALITEVSQGAGARRLHGAAAQSMDQQGMLAPLVKYAATVSDAELMPELVQQAILHATGGRPGPVALFLPSDMLESDASHVTVGSIGGGLSTLGARRTVPDERDLEAALAVLTRAERPIILAGGGAVISGAGPQILSLAVKAQMPVATTLTGAGAIPETHPLAVGVAGTLWGVDCAVAAVEQADVVFLVGTKCGTNSTMMLDSTKSTRRFVQLDIDATEVGKVFDHAVPLVGDAKRGLQALSALLDASNGLPDTRMWLAHLDGLKQRWQDWLSANAATDPVEGNVSCFAIVRELENRLQPGDIVVCDASSASAWGSFVRLPEGTQRVATRGIASLGSSLGAALGASLARPEARIIQLVGDGGLSYHIGELSTIARLGLPITTVVLNNESLGSLRIWPGFPEDTTRVAPADYAKIATASGWSGTTVGTRMAFRDALSAALGAGSPSLIDVRVHPDETPIADYRHQPLRGIPGMGGT